MRNMGVSQYYAHHTDLLIFLEFGKICKDNAWDSAPALPTMLQWIPTLVKNLRYAQHLYTYADQEQQAQALLSIPSPLASPHFVEPTKMGGGEAHAGW
jgi:hypothetical protein